MAKRETVNKAKYDAAHARAYYLKLNLSTDADIIAKLDAVPSMQGYIKQLIRNDIANPVQIASRESSAVVFDGYSSRNAHIRVKLDPDGHIYIVYDGGRRIRYNDEVYTKDSDFSFLLNDFKKS